MSQEESEHNEVDGMKKGVAHSGSLYNAMFRLIPLFDIALLKVEHIRKLNILVMHVDT